MESEKTILRLLINEKELVDSELIIYGIDPDDNNKVLLELNFNGVNVRKSNFGFFSALQDLRIYLEGQNCQVLCNGAAINVYPSPMQVNMACGSISNTHGASSTGSRHG
ncbi:MAG: hypothetical protein LBV08_04670 [Clostridiales bacterium]|jgi:hypothetical protein|nr:hypothetical protein [Clostridiales bacterium]